MTLSYFLIPFCIKVSVVANNFREKTSRILGLCGAAVPVGSYHWDVLEVSYLCKLLKYILSIDLSIY